MTVIILGLTIFMFTVALIDLRTRRVPLWLTLPVMGGALGYQVWWGEHIIGLIIAWGVAFLLWKLKLYGGGDAKVLMAIFGFFPRISLALALAVASLAVALPWLFFKYRHRLKESMTTIGIMAINGNIFPATRSYKVNGHPVVWIYTAGWLIWLIGKPILFY